MFSKTLGGLTLAGDLADQYFDNIAGEEYSGDESFIATLRALLHPRTDNESVSIRLRSTDYSADQIRRAGTKAVIDAIFGHPDPGSLIVHDVRGRAQESRDAYFECFDDPENGVVKARPGYIEITNIRDFVQNVMRIRVYTNENVHATVIFVDSLNLRKWHFLQSFIPRYFKWFFENTPLTEDEVELLKSLTRRSSDEYEKRIEDFAAKFDLRSFLIGKVIGDMEKRARRNQLEGVDRDIREARDHLDYLMDEYTNYVRRLDDLNIRRMGIEEAINNSAQNSELAEYLQMNKNIDILGARDHGFEFIVHTNIDSWDPELFETLVNKHGSSLYNSYGVAIGAFKPLEARKKFFNAVFSEDQKLRIKVCGYYFVDIRGTVNSASGYRYPANCRDRIPNPHLQKFNCLGNHRRIITECLKKGDVIGAVEQCIGSCKSLNFTEPQTFSYFFENIFKSHEKIIELPDHTSVTPEEALAWLNNQEENTEVEDNA